MPNNDLPDFAKQWVQQWKEAGTRLQAIRDEELRRKNPGVGSKARPVAGLILFDKYPERHGLVVFQRWMMRQALLTMHHTTGETRSGRE